MNRRDFLRLRPTSDGRSLDLPCRRLVMQYVDSERLATAGATLMDPDDTSWFGEPSPDVMRRAQEFLITQLERELGRVQVLRVLDDDWVRASGFSDRLAPVLDRFRAAGATVIVQGRRDGQGG